MSTIIDRIQELVSQEDWQASDHALQRTAQEAIILSDLADGITTAVVIEDYPSYYAGPCVLLLQTERSGPVHQGNSILEIEA